MCILCTGKWFGRTVGWDKRDDYLEEQKIRRCLEGGVGWPERTGCVGQHGEVRMGGDQVIGPGPTKKKTD